MTLYITSDGFKTFWLLILVNCDYYVPYSLFKNFYLLPLRKAATIMSRPNTSCFESMSRFLNNIVFFIVMFADTNCRVMFCNSFFEYMIYLYDSIS